LPDAKEVFIKQAIDNPDVSIILGSVKQDFLDSNQLVKLSDIWSFEVIDPQLFYMHCYGFDFEISGGNMIRVDTHGKDIAESSLITYILGSAFGVIGIQHGLIPIHGTAVAVGNKAVIVTGHTGSGKSAILSSLVMQGYKYLADDVSMIAFEDGIPFAFPSYPQRKIDASTASGTGDSIEGIIPKVENGRDKYAIRRASEWMDTKLPLSTIIEIVQENRPDETGVAPEIIEITGHASLMLVLRNLYRPQFVAQIGTPPERMKRLLELTSSVKAYQMTRPVEGFPINETANMIIERCFS